MAARLGRPQAALARQQQMLERLGLRLQTAPAGQIGNAGHALQRQGDRLHHGLAMALQQQRQASERLALRLAALDPQRVLERGYAWLSDAQGQPLTRAAQLQPGQAVQATLADGQVPLVVQGQA